MKNKEIYLLLLISFVLRAIAAASVELGNDEVYYRIFGLFPDWSYFDHPPMLAWLIRLTTLGAENISEFWVRLGPLLLGTLNTYLIYRIAGSGKMGFVAALLYTGSIYTSIILGVFVLPDTPLSLFWLLALGLFLQILPQAPDRRNGLKMLATGLLIGLAILSKYTGAYLWVGAGLYILFYNRSWLKRWELWIAGALSLIMLYPIFKWNMDNNWISFTFHSARVTADQNIHWDYFLREVVGGIFYNNPINIGLIIFSLFLFLKTREKSSEDKLLLFFSIPFILLFLGISFTRETLPHWAAPAYFGLMIFVAHHLKKIKWAYISALFMGFVLILGILQINLGLFDLGGKKEGLDRGTFDFTLDMYGWKQGGEKFATLHRNYVEKGEMPEDAALVQGKWFDAAHLDMYFGLPLGLKTKTIGDTAYTHYYEWINARRGGFKEGEDVYLVVASTHFFEAPQTYQSYFNEILPADTLNIYRRDRHVSNFYVYRMKGYRNPQ